MEADENLATADNGSPSEGKSEALTDFSYEYNDMILHLEPRTFIYEQNYQGAVLKIGNEKW